MGQAFKRLIIQKVDRDGGISTLDNRLSGHDR
jgi:hypothetical protein